MLVAILRLGQLAGDRRENTFDPTAQRKQDSDCDHRNEGQDESVLD